jgi:uncharacterized protein
MKVEVVRARPQGAETVSVELPARATVRAAVTASGLPHDNLFGVFGRRVGPEHRLTDGDRVEIYRPLAIDPKEARRRRAKKTR